MLFVKKLYLICLILLSVLSFSQKADSIKIQSGSVFKKLKLNDSLIFYQCHVESGTQQLSTASGQTITGSSKKYSITEKYVLIKQQQGYRVRYFVAALNVFPNKKFTGLKFKERAYWDFKEVKSFLLQDTEILPFLALEEKGREAVVYDYGISKYTTNQLIIRYANDYKQLVIEGPYVLSKLMRVEEK